MTRGTRTFSVTGMAGQIFSPRLHGFAETAGLGVEFGRLVGRRLELGVELLPAIWISQPRTFDGQGRENVYAVAADLILRWYPDLLGPRVLPYLEAAEGPAWSPDRMPVAGTRFNFLTQFGVGCVFRTGESWSTVLGWRFAHISNANLGEHDPGWTFSLLLVGGRLYLP